MLSVSPEKAKGIVKQIATHLDEIRITNVDEERGMLLNADATFDFDFRNRKFVLVRTPMVTRSFGPAYRLKLNTGGGESIIVYPARPSAGLPMVGGYMLTGDREIEGWLEQIISHINQYADKKINDTLGEDFFS